MRERRSSTLYDMMNDAIEVVFNLMASCNIQYNPETFMNKDQEEAHPSTSKSSDAKFDLMVKTMEKLVENMSLDKNHAIIDENALQLRNPNFMRLPVTKIG